MLPVANQSPCHPVAGRQPRLGRAFPGAYSFSIMMKCQSGNHSSWKALSMPTQDPLESLSHQPHLRLHSTQAPCYPVTLLPRGCQAELASPGQVAVNFVPRFACFRQFGTRNRARVQVECPLVPSRTAACTSLICTSLLPLFPL